MKATVAKLRRRRTAVLWGGTSAEREISKRSARSVCAALDRWGLAHTSLDLGPRVAEDLRRHKINLAFLVTHGTWGEDGRLQGLLDVLGIAYTGSGVRASALAMHKPTAKRIFEHAGLPTPRWTVCRRGESSSAPVDAAGRALPWPVVVKPAGQGSAVGVTVARTPREFRAGLRCCWRWEEEALVEVYVPGTEVTVGLLDDRILPVVEILPSHAFYDFHSKYAPGGSRHLIPARLSSVTRRKVQELAAAAFHGLGCRHVGRADLMVDRAGRPTLLEMNTLPGLTDTSLLPDAARAAGLDFDGLVLKLLELALRDGS